MPGYDDDVNQQCVDGGPTRSVDDGAGDQRVAPSAGGTDQGDQGDQGEYSQNTAPQSWATGDPATGPDGLPPAANWWWGTEQDAPERCLDQGSETGEISDPDLTYDGLTTGSHDVSSVRQSDNDAPQGGFFSQDHNTNETAWDVVGVIPGVGNVVNGFNAVSDAYDVATADNAEKRGQAMRDLAQDALGAIPLVGNVISAARVVYDANAGNDSAHDALDRMMGGKEKQTPEAYQDDHPPALPAPAAPALNRSTEDPNQSGP